MNTYVCQSIEGGIEFTHAFDAKSDRRAEKIARKRGWTMLYSLEEGTDNTYYELELETASVH